MENINHKKPSATAVVKEIRRRTKRLFSAEEKIKIVLECLRGEDSVASICRKYGIHQNSYYTWSKDFLEAGKRRLSGDTTRDANRDEVGDMVKENEMLKRELANLYLENTVLKKSINGFGSDPMSR
jgi:transposase